MKRPLLLIFLIAFIYTLKANDTLTRAEIYDFNVGDTFDYKSYSCTPTYGYSYSRYLITGIDNSLQPGKRLLYRTQTYPLPQTQDILIIDSLSTAELLTYSGCNIVYDWNALNSVGTNCNQRSINKVSTDACGTPQPGYRQTAYTYSFGRGLGLVEYRKEHDWDCRLSEYETMIYYSKSGERCGTPILGNAHLRHYTPIPEECAVWTDTIYASLPPSEGNPSIVEQIRSGNKIPFNGHTYIEMIYRSFNFQTNYYTEDSLVGYYRNDTANQKLLFFQSMSNQSFLEYDFNYLCPAPDCLSQITIGGQIRTKWTDYIEGVGGTQGLLQVKRLYYDYPPNGPPDYPFRGKLTSFCVCGQELYASNSTAACPLLTSIPSITSTYPVFTLFPNPATSFLNITVDGSVTDGKISITDVTGRTIRTAKMNSEKLDFAVDFPSGLYFVTLNNGPQSVTRKLVVSK